MSRRKTTYRKQHISAANPNIANLDKMRDIVTSAVNGEAPQAIASRQLADITVKILKSIASADILNRKVKVNPTPPKGMDEEQFKELLDGGVLNNEQAARALSYDIASREYTYQSIIKTYQDIMTDCDYITPCYADDMDDKLMLRELNLLDKMRRRFRAKEAMHNVRGRTLYEGKAFYYHEYKVDKSHNKCIENRLIPLPSDWCRIIDMLNPISKYTIAFDMTYFWQYPEDLIKYGNLFMPYIDEFQRLTKRNGNEYGIDFESYRDTFGVMPNQMPCIDTPLAVQVKGLWQYWVVLPIELVWTFELNDITPWAAPIFTGLFRALLRLSPAEDIFMELAQNPLISIMTGEIPYYSDKTNDKTVDNFAMSITKEGDKAGGRSFWNFFNEEWYELLRILGTRGVGFFSAPFNDMKLHQMTEAPYVDKLMSTAQKHAISKSAMAGILPTTESVLAAQVNVATKVAAAFSKTIYSTAERMWDRMIYNLNLKYEYKYSITGDIFSNEKRIAAIEKSLSLGFQNDMFEYLALKDTSVLEMYGASEFINKFGIMDMMRPVVSGYHTSGAGGPEGSPMGRPSGRPRMDVEDITSEETERTRGQGDGEAI